MDLQQSFHGTSKKPKKTGVKIISDDQVGGRRVVRFSNGGHLVGHKSGFTVHAYVNGVITQYSPNGTLLTVGKDGAITQVSTNGIKVTVQADGTTVTTLRSGSRIIATPDGKLVQKNANETSSEMSSMSKYLFQNSQAKANKC